MPSIKIIMEGAKYWAEILKDEKISRLIFKIDKKLQSNIVDLVLIKKLETQIERSLYARDI